MVAKACLMTETGSVAVPFVVVERQAAFRDDDVLYQRTHVGLDAYQKLDIADTLRVIQNGVFHSVTWLLM